MSADLDALMIDSPDLRWLAARDYMAEAEQAVTRQINALGLIWEFLDLAERNAGRCAPLGGGARRAPGRRPGGGGAAARGEWAKPSPSGGMPGGAGQWTGPLGGPLLVFPCGQAARTALRAASLEEIH